MSQPAFPFLQQALSRRAALGALGILGGVGAVCLSSANLVGQAHAASTPMGAWLSLGHGVYVVCGANQEVSRANAGKVVNTGIVATAHGVVVIDPGPHRRWAEHVSRMVQRHLRQPIRWVINTHAHPEAVLGNSAFAHLPIYASASTAWLMRQQCPSCLARLRRTVGEAVMRGTRIVLPTQTLAHGQTLVLGGRTFRCEVFDHAHTRGDLAVWDAAGSTLFAGGLAYRQRVPELSEASLQGWLAALQSLNARFSTANMPAWVVGAGLGAWGDTVVATQAYLQSLQEQVRAALARGEDLSVASRQLELAAWQGWAHYRTRHPLNVQHAWRELEPQFF